MEDVSNEIERDFIYHYTKTSKALEEILCNMELKFSPLKDLNDPREYGNWPFMCEYGSGKIIENLDQEVNNFIKNRFKVACFSESKYSCEAPETVESYGYYRSRMWSQYAGNHSGVCLVFSKKSIENQIKQTINSAHIFLGEVEYTKCTYIDDRKLSIHVDKYEKNKDSYLLGYVKSHFKEFFFEKNSDYRDESEYRIVYYTDNPGDSYINIQDSIKGIILGDNFHDVYLPLIWQHVKKNNLFCTKMSCANGHLFESQQNFEEYE